MNKTSSQILIRMLISLLSSFLGYYLFIISLLAQGWTGQALGMVNPFSETEISLFYLPIGFVVALIFSQFTRHFLIPSAFLNAFLLWAILPRFSVN